MKRKFSFKVILLGITGFILSLFTLIIGAPFIKVLRKAYPSWMFWGLGVAFSLMAGPFWYFVAAPWFLVGFTTELENRGLRYDVAGFWATISIMFALGMAIFVLQKAEVDFMGSMYLIIEQMVAQIKRFNPESPMTTESFVDQLPSFLIGSFIAIIASAASFERAAHLMFRLPYKKNLTLGDYFDFKVPAWAFWLSLIGMALSMFKLPDAPWTAVLALNVVNVFLILYFIQGAIIGEYYLRMTKAGMFTRVLVYFLMMGPLVLGIIAIGFVDFWLDFRVRIQKLTSLNTNKIE